MTRIVLDISRLISRVHHSRPSGVDRVEMAYARGLLDIYGANLDLAAVHPTGVYGRLSRAKAVAYLGYLDDLWANPLPADEKRSIPTVLRWMRRLLPLSAGIGSADVVVQVSPHHLNNIEKKRRILEREKARFVCMIHDLIPIEYPEYARPGGSKTHQLRMATVLELADAVIANSSATGASFVNWAKDRGWDVPPVNVALLGTQRLPEPTLLAPFEQEPYFVCLGTIEPRKNHLLLLNQWRHMTQSLKPDEVPRLKVIGRRGWENEQIVDMLERSTAIGPYVEEINNCSDNDLATILRGAKALLMPSFAEGYGMPIAEALASGTPVIASDIEAHREAGGDAPDFIHPLDGPRWQEVILDHAGDGPLRQNQLNRLKHWSAPQWSGHMNIAQRVIESVLD